MAVETQIKKVQMKAKLDICKGRTGRTEEDGGLNTRDGAWCNPTKKKI